MFTKLSTKRSVVGTATVPAGIVAQLSGIGLAGRIRGARRKQIKCATLTNCILVCVATLMAITASPTAARANLLGNAGFEVDQLYTISDVLDHFSTYSGAWGVEAATVTGPDDGVIPAQGARMLRMVNDGLTVTQGFQVTDATSYASLIAGGATANLSVLFNAADNVPAAIGGISLHFYSAADYDTEIGVGTSDILALDNDPETWETASVSVPIPVNARWIVSEVLFNDASIGRSAGYVDAADLTIVPEPAAPLLLASGAIGLLAFARRRPRRTAALLGIAICIFMAGASQSSAADLVWTGAGSDYWDVNISLNWSNGFMPDRFANGDSATFDDSSMASTVNIVGTVVPSSITENAFTDYTFTGSGQISGSGGLTKNGAGSLTIVNPSGNTYTGISTVNGGTLFVDSGIISPSIVNGGTIGGIGYIGNLRVNSGGELATGHSAPGILTAYGNAYLNGVDEVEVFGPVAGATYDQFVVHGAVTLGGILSVNKPSGFSPDPAADKFWIILNDGSNPTNGAFMNYADGDTVFTDNSTPWAIHYSGDYATGSLSGGNDVVIAPVPEPGTWLLLAAACLAVLAYRRIGRRS
jgi:autotransporter-associated beta strand protein